MTFAWCESDSLTQADDEHSAVRARMEKDMLRRRLIWAWTRPRPRFPRSRKESRRHDISDLLGWTLTYLSDNSAVRTQSKGRDWQRRLSSFRFVKHHEFRDLDGWWVSKGPLI